MLVCKYDFGVNVVITVIHFISHDLPNKLLIC